MSNVFFNEDMNRLYRFLVDNNIDRLYHFTQAENLTNIIRGGGLLSRKYLEQHNMHSAYNDASRYDGLTNGICTSVEFPNYRMFWAIRHRTPDADWAVLHLDIRALLELPCACFWTNASDNTMRSLIRHSMDYLRSNQAFFDLFKNREGFPTREQTGVPSYYPTNPQAEIIFFDRIPLKYIECICFENNAVMSKYERFSKACQLEVRNQVFRPRDDYAHWKRKVG